MGWERAKIRPIYVSQKPLKDLPLGGWSLRSRMQDASKVARERALAMQPTELEIELQQQGAKYKAAALEAIARVKHVLDDKSYFTRQARESAKYKRDSATQQKRSAYEALMSTPVEKGSGLQCKGRNCRANMHVTFEQMQVLRAEVCSLAGASPPKGGAEKEAVSKADLLQQMLSGSFPDHGGHELELRKNYVSFVIVLLISCACLCRNHVGTLLGILPCSGKGTSHTSCGGKATKWLVSDVEGTPFAVSKASKPRRNSRRLVDEEVCSWPCRFFSSSGLISRNGLLARR